MRLETRFNLGDVLTPIGGKGTLTVKAIDVQVEGGSLREWYDFEESGIVLESHQLELMGRQLCGICHHEEREVCVFKTADFIPHLESHFQEFIEWDGTKYVSRALREEA